MPTNRSTNRLTHAAAGADCAIDLIRVDAEDAETAEPDKLLEDVAGILVPGGFGDRGVARQDPGDPICAGGGGSIPWSLPRYAGRDDRVCPQRVRTGRSELDRVRSRRATPGHFPARDAKEYYRQGRLDAPRHLADPDPGGDTRFIRSMAKRRFASGTAIGMNLT